MPTQRSTFTSGTDGTGRRAGGVLGVVLVVLLGLSVLTLAFLQRVQSAAVATSRTYDRERAFWTAEAGLHHLKAVLARHNEPLDELGLLVADALSANWAGGEYHVDISADPDWDNASHRLQRYIALVRGIAPGATTRALCLRFELRSMASFAWYAHTTETVDGDRVYWATGDVLDGPLQTGGELNIWHDPVFTNGPVYSEAGTVNYQSPMTPVEKEEVFDDVSLQLGVSILDWDELNVEESLQDVRAGAQSGGLYLPAARELVFLEDGRLSYVVQTATNAVTNTVVLSALNGNVYVEGSVNLRGVANTPELSVGVGNTINVTGNVLYQSARSPGPWQTGFNPAAVDDRLSLLAGTNVQVMGTTSITIHAAIFVAGPGGLSAENYNVTIPPKPPNLYIYGCIGQEFCGYLGRESHGEGAPPTAKGFNKIFKYDERFREDPPDILPYVGYFVNRWEILR